MDLSDSASSVNSAFATGEVFTEESDATPSITSSCTASPSSAKKKANNHSSASDIRKPLPAIKRLPPELMLQIFDHLEAKRDQWAFCMSCRAWFMSAIENVWFRPNLTNEATLSKFLNVVSKPTTELTVDYPLFVKRLNLASCADFVTDGDLLKALSCTSLERLTLVGCNLLTDESLPKLISINPNIQSIDISGVVKVTDITLNAIADNCLRLQGLYASMCANLTDSGVQNFAQNCHYLKRLKINGCPEISDETMREITEKTRHLVELDVSMCPQVTNEYVVSAFTKLPHLREFRVASDSNIDDVPFMHLPESARYEKLRIVDLTLCHLITDNTVRQLVRVAPRLRNVVLGKCANITDRSIQYLSALGRNLQYLHLGHCTQLTDRGINALVRACNRIQYIDVACCGQLTDMAVKDLASLPKLRRIGLVKCLNITDAAIYALAQKTGSENTLERIHLSYCAKISLEAIMRLVNSCQKLTHLSLTGVPPFIRSDLTQFCRPPPPEFNQHQQALFCVFSGKGVEKLRNHLNELSEQLGLDIAQSSRPYVAAHIAYMRAANFHVPVSFPENPLGEERLAPALRVANLNGQLAGTAGEGFPITPVFIREYMGNYQRDIGEGVAGGRPPIGGGGGLPPYEAAVGDRNREPALNVENARQNIQDALRVFRGADEGEALDEEDDDDMEDLLE